MGYTLPMLMIAKIVGVLVFGTILAMPVHVLVGSVLAPWKIKERRLLVMSVAFSYAVVVALIFGSD